MRPDLPAIEALDAVIRYGGLAQAAARMHKVQSAVIYQIRKLERQVGVALLDRNGYRLRLTTAGEAVLAEGRRLLAQADHLSSVARQFSAGWEPRLTLVVDGILPLAPSMHALKALADERVPTCVQLRVEFLGGVQQRFDQDQAELMLAKDFNSAPLLQATALPELECILCGAPDHPLARQRRVSLPDLQQHVELTVQDSSGAGNDRHRFGSERVFYMSGFIAKKQAILMGVGYGWMPHYLVAEEMATGELAELRYSGGSRYRFTPLLVNRTDKPLGRAARRLLDLLRAAHAASTQSAIDPD